jgi:hypothetical protein
MNLNISNTLTKLLDAYLGDLKTEADTVTHIVSYINESTAQRAALAEQLESYFGTHGNKPEPAEASGSVRDPAHIQSRADVLLKGLGQIN